MIPKLGAAGAAIGTLVAEFVVLCVQFFVLRKELLDTFKHIKYYKILIGMAGGCAASIWVMFMNFGNFIALLISAVLFFGVYFVLLLVLKEELASQIIGQFADKVRSKLKKQ